MARRLRFLQGLLYGLGQVGHAAQHFLQGVHIVAAFD